MNKFFKWVKEHCRPYYKYHKTPEEIIRDEGRDQTMEEKIDDLKEKSEVGLKFTFKF